MMIMQHRCKEGERSVAEFAYTFDFFALFPPSVCFSLFPFYFFGLEHAIWKRMNDFGISRVWALLVLVLHFLPTLTR